MATPGPDTGPRLRHEDASLIRDAVQEAMSPIVSHLKDEISDAIRTELPERVADTLDGLLEMMRELRKDCQHWSQKRNSPNGHRSPITQMTHLIGKRKPDKACTLGPNVDLDEEGLMMTRRGSAPPLRPPRFPEANDLPPSVPSRRAKQALTSSSMKVVHVTIDQSDPVASEETPSRGSISIARAALTAHRACARLARPDTGDESDAESSPGRRVRPTLSSGSTRPQLGQGPHLPPSGMESVSLDLRASISEASISPSPVQQPPVPLPLPLPEQRVPETPAAQLEVFGGISQVSRSSSQSSGKDRMIPVPSASGRVLERVPPTILPATSMVLGPGMFRHNTEEQVKAPFWQRLLRSWGLDKQRTESFQQVELGNKQRRNALAIQDSEVQELSRWWRWRARSCLSWPFSDPSSQPRQYWEILACLLLFLQLLYLCFQAAFFTDADYQDSDKLSLKVALVAVDGFWLVDLALNFTTGYRDALQVLHCNLWSNAKRYARSWLLIDLIATLPSFAVHTLLIQDQQQFGYWSWRFMAFAPLVRAPRFGNAWSILRRIEADLASTSASSVWGLFQLFMLPVIFSHFSACALWSLGRSNLDWDPTARSWIKLGLDISNEPGALQAVPLGERYMTSMYFAVTVMSTVGLGDINMSLANERGLLCVIMATTSLVVGVAVSGVTEIVSKLSERTAVTKERLAKVSKFLRVYGAPGDLQTRVHAYLQQFFENQERDETKSMLMQWLKKSEVLRVNVNLALTGTCLAQHHLLQLVPRNVLANICDICDMEFHPPGQELIEATAEVKSCFYIRAGAIECLGAKGPAMKTRRFSQDLEDGVDEVRREIEEADADRPDQTLQNGAFIGDFRLFLGPTRSWKTATCLSFCELISIDVQKFRSLMAVEVPELFDALVIYTAIDNHCPKVMLQCLEEQGLSAEVPLLFGEGVLHHCAKVNAVDCAECLIKEFGARVNVVDEEQKTPAQVAAKLKHKAVFWTIIQHGSVVTDADVLPPEVHAVSATKGWRRARIAPAVSFIGDDDCKFHGPKTLQELRELLATAGINVDQFGIGGHKSMDDLLEELRSCESELIAVPGKRIYRRVTLCRVRLLAIIDNRVRALVELQPDCWLQASDQKLGKLPCRRLRRGQSEDEAARELLQELGLKHLDSEWLSPITTTFHTETRVSMSYPGLETEYVIHEASWKARAHALQQVPGIGLPDGMAFSQELRQYFWPILTNIALDGDEPERPPQKVRFSPRDARRAGSSGFLGALFKG